jgi:hypothetical protein
MVMRLIIIGGQEHGGTHAKSEQKRTEFHGSTTGNRVYAREDSGVKM